MVEHISGVGSVRSESFIFVGHDYEISGLDMDIALPFCNVKKTLIVSERHADNINITVYT